MDPKHIFTLPFHANPQRLDPCLNKDWIAIPVNKTVIGIWKILNVISTQSNTKPPPKELIGHDKEIRAIAFGSGKSDCLASVSREKVLLWDLQSLQSDDTKHEVFFMNPGDATCMCFSNSNEIIAIGVDAQILLLERKMSKPTAILEVHRGMVTHIQFCPHYSATMVSISDDRTFCVWDVSGMSLLYQSTIISPAPLISMSMNLLCPHLAIGTSDGSLKVFDLSDGHDFRMLANLDIAVIARKELNKPNYTAASTEPKIVTKQGVQKRKDSNELDGNPGIAQSSESVLAIQYAYFTKCSTVSSENIVSQRSGAGDILNELPPSICLVTSNALIQLDARSLQVKKIIDLHESFQSASFSGSKLIGSVSIAGVSQCGADQMAVVVGAMFERSLDVISWHIQERRVHPSLDTETSTSNHELSEEIVVIPKLPLLESSPLRSDMLPAIIAKPVTKGDVATGKKKATNPMNQPLTFKSKVKSSGYTAAPRTTMFKPETRRSKLLNLDKEVTPNPTNQSVSLSKALETSYGVRRGPPSEHCDTFVADSQAAAVLGLSFAGDGSGLACSLSNKTALTLKAPFSKQISIPFVGHDGNINSVQWSNDNSLLLTASCDKKVFLWSRTGGDPLMVFSHTKNNHIQSGSDLQKPHNSNDSKPSENKVFSKEIKSAQFYFMDKFILMMHGSTFGLYKYLLTPEKDEIKRYSSKNRYKLVSTWETTSSSFTALAAANTFLSYIVVCATSGRNLEVYDLNRSSLAHTFSDCHSRQVHCIAMNEGSCYASQPPDAHNVMATIAPTDPIKLWDLRTKNRVQALQGHLNNAHACHIAFSPCGNYLATGSENKTAFIYDLRKGTYVERLKGHTGVVTSVAFHPAYPLLATGGLDSKILFYKSK